MVESDYTKILLALISSGILGYLVRTIVDGIKNLIKFKYTKESLKEKYDQLYQTLLMLMNELDAERVLVLNVTKDETGEYLSILYETTYGRKLKYTIQHEELAQEYRELFNKVNIEKSVEINTVDLPKGFYKIIAEMDSVIYTYFFLVHKNQNSNIYLCLHLKDTITNPSHKELIRQSIVILKNWFRGEK